MILFNTQMLRVLLGKRENKNTLTKPMYFKTHFKVFKMWFHYLNTIFKPPSYIYTHFQTWLLGRNYVIIITLGRKHKNYSNPFWIRIFLFLSYSFEIETIKMFLHSRGSLENSTRFQTKMDKVYTCFYTKTAQKTLPDGAAHTYMAYIREYPPPPAGF